MGYLVSDNVEDNNEIFKFLYPTSNDMLSKMSNSDRLYMLSLIKKYYLDLRNKLELSSDITFGLELEFEECNRNIIDKEIEKNFYSKGWRVKDDGSLINGGEVITPRLSDSDDIWIDLRRVCDILDKNSFLMDNTGGHIHIGMHILGNNPKYWGNFAKLWMTYENVIFRFLYGEYISARKGILDQARPISSDLIKNLDRINDRAKKINAYQMFKVLDAGDNFKERRKRAVNFTNVDELSSYQYDMILDGDKVKNTIEFRSPNGTLNPVIWQNNVNLLVHLFMYAKSDRFNEDIINTRMLQIIDSKIPSNLRMYSRIYVDQAIELADLIFDNNLDKVYFLRQYFKFGMVSNEPLVKSENFTRIKYK